jgi:hypothetical protein
VSGRSNTGQANNFFLSIEGKVDAVREYRGVDV